MNLLPNPLAFERQRIVRRRFFFCVTGLSARNEILLKSQIRLLQNVTHHDWIYSVDGQDLEVMGEVDEDNQLSDGVFLGAQIPAAKTRLWVGDTVQGRQFQLALPLHFKDLETALNRVSEWLVAQDESVKHMATSDPTSSGQEIFQLLRWPPAACILNAKHTKAATLLIKSPFGLSALAKRTEMSERECAEFLYKLPYLARSLAASDRNMASASRAGVHARELFTKETGSPGVGAASQTTTSQKRGNMLARIRNRLGLT